MAGCMCSSLQALSLQQARPARLTPVTRKYNASSLTISCRHSTFSSGQKIQQQQLHAQSQQACAVTCLAKGKKLKTRKAAAKRFKVTGSGKVLIRHPGKQHINEKKPSKRLSQLGKSQTASDRDLPGIKGNLPYKSITKSGN